MAGNVWYGPMPAGCGKGIASPGWVGGGDYHLTSGSRARNAGDPRYAPARDIDGSPRDSTPDAGADEWYTPPGRRERAARLVTGMHVTRTKRGFVLRSRLARRARVGAWVDRRKHRHYHAVRHLRTRPLAAGKRHIRLGRLRRAPYRIRLLAIESTGKRSHPKLRFRVRRATRLSRLDIP